MDILIECSQAQYCPHGTLLDMTNKYRQHGNALDPDGVAFKE